MRGLTYSQGMVKEAAVGKNSCNNESQSEQGGYADGQRFRTLVAVARKVAPLRLRGALPAGVELVFQLLVAFWASPHNSIQKTQQAQYAAKELTKEG